MSFPRHARCKQRGNTFVGVAIGLLIGILIAVVIALYINFGSKPFTQKEDKASQASAPVATPVAPASSEPIALPGKPGDKPVTQPTDKPSYDFYKILPGGDAASVPVSAPSGEPAAPDKLYLQAGAFQDPAEADNLKARLALMGLEAGVQKVDTADKGVLHRVRVGPFPGPGEADTAHAKLAQEGIETVIVRVKPRK
ncbi:SPOR domain-containing protein [Uliginosibacterium sp. H3]|uniref:SPOR domain-containing protein n=1 Tax=Uliginosibacterium silvisoli TaxID=3114758 RepID=A0ABU6JZB7_9RHOO|nr:SPOR domain-containing protein [Uliginosibacterium sp. H3]